MVLLYNRPGGQDEREGVAPFSPYLSHFLTPISGERLLLSPPISLSLPYPYLWRLVAPFSPYLSLTSLPLSLVKGCSFLPLSLSYFLTPISQTLSLLYILFQRGRAAPLSSNSLTFLSFISGEKVCSSLTLWLSHFCTFYLRKEGLLMSHPLILPPPTFYLKKEEFLPSNSLTSLLSISIKKGCSSITELSHLLTFYLRKEGFLMYPPHNYLTSLPALSGVRLLLSHFLIFYCMRKGCSFMEDHC